MFGGAKSFYLEIGGEGIATILALEESRAFLFDP